MTEDYTPIKKTMTERMVGIYCKDVHGGDRPCPECTGWLEMAFSHLDGCRHKEKGWPCDTCPDRCFTGNDLIVMTTVQDHMASWMSEHPEEAIALMPPVAREHPDVTDPCRNDDRIFPYRSRKTSADR